MAHHVAGWRTSSFSSAGNCVGLREQTDGSVAVCNTNDPGAGLLALTRPEMVAWIVACKTGHLDDLT
jgi:hypothetical protein